MAGMKIFSVKLNLEEAEDLAKFCIAVVTYLLTTCSFYLRTSLLVEIYDNEGRFVEIV